MTAVFAVLWSTVSNDRCAGTRQSPRRQPLILPRVRVSGAPLREERTAMISATIDTAVSAGVREPMSRPAGP